MRNYLKLVNFEINRFFKIYVALISLTAVVQLIGSAVVANEYMKQAKRMLYREMMPQSQFLEQHGPFSFMQVVYSPWFGIPIFLCIASLMIYVFFIWYRDWVGKNTFAYRLLTLPVERIIIYLAKLKAIMLFVLGLVSVQIILVMIEKQVTQVVVPNALRTDVPTRWILKYDVLSVLYPDSLLEFIAIYGLGCMFVAVLFTAILFERSYRWKGIVFAIGYGVISFIVFIAPMLLNSFVWINYFYQTELLWMLTAISFLIFISAIWIANYLLKYKIKV